MKNISHSIDFFMLFILALALPINASAADESTTEKSAMGRLFSQPSEREALDDLRKDHRLREPKVITKTYTPEPVKPLLLPKPVTMQGYVKRSDGGQSTIWINHQPIQENTQLNDIKIGKLTQHRETTTGKKTAKNIDRLEINIPANGKHIQLKAGQQYEPETNRIKEVTTIAKEKQLHLDSTDEDGELPSNE